ncbi:hypothetical protein J3A84_08290 [Proteiniclasticum sp. SCR006]|uniref:Streptococcal pilin isopeptide linker domain-containing protein n=1 Tax=Proteiniclasticum aestuarii TaxID=2817862 RepID=A0A939H689_9CLOT|nr:FctA domain-containing protein [Proteiniclasticum aestuarii]MBO1265022.1 hypothetical protein [Proteiniclasticum aestuarii]
MESKFRNLKSNQNNGRKYKMKKILTFLAAFTFIFGLSVNAFASTEGYYDWSPIEINKMLEINNPGTVNPAETFNFVIGTGTGVRDGLPIAAPAFTPNTFSIDVLEGMLGGKASVNLPLFTQVGVYTYPVMETAGNTAGMDYDPATYYIVVTVINNPAYPDEGEPEFLRVLTLTDANNVKRDKFDNDFDAGDLTVDKEITGNFADPDDEFTITVTVTPVPGKVIKDGPIEWNTNDVTEVGGVYTAVYVLKGGESFTIENLPYDVSYTVVETQDPDYDMPQYDAEATGDMDMASISTTIINNRDTTVNTGISLDSLPYILILGFAASGMGLLFFRRRHAF